MLFFLHAERDAFIYMNVTYLWFNLILTVMFCRQICYFFYKNIAFGLTLFYFEAFAGFSGQSVYDDWYMLSFNVVLTALPVISLGVFEQDVSSEICLQVCATYKILLANPFLY